MKKLALLTVLIATPALACPDMESKTDNAPRTAEKDKKETPKKDTTAKAKEQPKKEAPPAKTDDKAKTAKPEQKPAPKTDKVSSK
jgi:hypothetical protein